jgi:hypothetical protein
MNRPSADEVERALMTRCDPGKRQHGVDIPRNNYTLALNLSD